MSWVGVITDAGRSIYEAAVAGTTLNISSLKLGKGSVSQEDMRSLTALDDEVTDGVIESMEVKTDGVQFKLRANAAPADVGAYTLTEMGLFVTYSGSEVLFAYCMDTGSGIGIPTEETFPDFLFILTTNLVLDNHADFSFTIDPSSFVSYTQFVTEQTRVNTAMAGLKSVQSPVSDPAASGTSLTFIATISQNAQGVITVTKKTVSTMTAATSGAAGKGGLVPAPAAGAQTKFLRGDGTWAVPTNTTYNVFSGATSGAAGSTGLVPAPSAGAQDKFLRGDGTWAVPTNTTYNVFTGATSSAAGSSGLVPAPAAGAQAKFLRGDGTWAVPTNTTYSAGTGLSLTGTSFSLADSGVTAGSYGPSAAVTGTEGTTINVPYITVDRYGRVTAIANKVLTNKNTTYADFTGASASAAGAHGLVPAPAKGDQAKFLRADKTWAVPTNTQYSAGTGLTLTGTVFSVSKANVSDIINLLDTASSDLSANDYVVTQYAGGGTTYTTYYRRPASKIVNAGLVKAALGTASSHGGKFLRMDGTWVVPPNTTYSNMGGATSTAAGSAGLVPAPAAGKQGSFLRGDGTWAVPTNTTYSAASGGGLVLSGTAFSLATSGVTAGSYGPSAAVTGTEGTTINIPYITVDKYGRVTAISNKVLTNKNTTYADFTGASSSAAGSHGLVPAPAKGDQAKFLRADKTWAVPTNTTYSAGTGLSLSGTVFSLDTSGVTAGTYGPTGNVTGSEGTTIKIPQIKVDAYGRVTSVAERTLTNKNTNTWRGFQRKSYHYQWTLGAGAALNITGNMFGMGNGVSGYTPVAFSMWNPGNVDVVPVSLDCNSLGTEVVMTIVNHTNATKGGDAWIEILFLQNS